MISTNDNPPMLIAARPSKVQIGILLLIAAFGVALRVYHIGAVGFWYDEAASISLACGNWHNLFFPITGYYEHAPGLASKAGMLPIYRLIFETDSHPPAYVLMLRGWWVLFGMGDVSCRMLSAVASAAAIFFVFDVARLLATPTTGLWAAAMLAAAPTQIRYAQEARSYAMLVLLGAALCDGVLRIYKFGPSRRRWIAVGGLVLTIFLMHYFLAGALAGIGIFAVWRMRGRTRWALVVILVSSLAVLVASRLPVVLTHRSETAAGVSYLAEDRDGIVGRTLLRSATVPMWLMVAPRDDARASGAAAGLLLILPFLLDRLRPGLALCGCWAGGLIGLIAASDILLGHNALLYARYTVAAAPMVIVATAVIADLGGQWLRHALPALAVIGALIAVPSVYRDEFWEKTESRLWANDIPKDVDANDILVVSSSASMGLYSASYEYLFVDHYRSPLPCAVAICEGPPDAKTLERIWSHRRVIVAACYYSVDPTGVLGPCRIVRDGPIRYGVGRVVVVERETPTSSTTAPSTARSASRHST